MGYDYLTKLPGEIITQILLELPFTDLPRCSVVCKTFRSIVTASSSIQYCIKLGLLGYADDSRNEHGSAEHYSFKCGSMFSCITSGTLAFVQRFPPSKIASFRLPSTIRGADGSDTLPAVHMVGFVPKSATIDPEQDLLALLELTPDGELYQFSHYIHLRSLSTYESHPSAAIVILQVPKIWLLFGEFSLEYIGETIALFARDYHRTIAASLFISQWTTGLLMTRISFPKPNIPDQFSFLSPTKFLLTRSLYDPPVPDRRDQINHSSGETPTIEIYTISHNSSLNPLGSDLLPTHAATFMLPAMQSGILVDGFRCEVGVPRVAPTSALPRTCTGGHGPCWPFFTLPKNRTLQFYFYWDHGGTVFFVRASTLLDYNKYRPAQTPLPSLSSSSPNPIDTHADAGAAALINIGGNDDSNLITIPWREWGPHNTRLLDSRTGLYGGSYGSKVGCLATLHANHAIIRVPDSNPYSLNGGEALTEGGTADGGKAEGVESQDTWSTLDHKGGDVRSRDVTWTSVTLKGSLFMEDVYTSLPYRETIKDVEYDGVGILMDEESIILLQGGYDVFRVYTL
ncbi:hypothetical protein BOTBODRAFT_58105 [Botryobasidium botryosum FD-172 SS1]|uniref:F-box domain-containing protein n=1 Tax=Botryobasidium botryosum (strain FD-172 SS1) TaxID=930990 RepID=A0A067M4B5_BOTB1|nr:hypothetical protein BOTBODRAFT_58105 [Botryobasidium botryosum FD-172 SS1]